MLKIKYFESFKDDLPFVVITSDREGLISASRFFGQQNGAFLNDASVTEFSDVAPLQKQQLYLNAIECKKLAQHFRNLYEINEARHSYFDIEALGDEIEVIISFMEYDNLF